MALAFILILFSNLFFGIGIGNKTSNIISIGTLTMLYKLKECDFVAKIWIAVIMICIGHSSSGDFITIFFGLMIEVCSRWLRMKNASLMHWLFYIFGQASNINIAPSPCIFGIGIGKILKIYMQLAFEALAPANPPMSEEEEKSNQEPRFVIGFYEGKIDSHYDLISCSNLKETKTKEKRLRLLGESEKNRILLQKSIGDRMDQQKQQDSLSLKRTIFFVIFNKVSHQFYIIFQALCRQELKDPSNKSSYSDDQWMKWHNDQKALLAYMFFLEFELCNANEFKNFLFPAGSLEKKEQIY